MQVEIISQYAQKKNGTMFVLRRKVSIFKRKEKVLQPEMPKLTL
jgi:hypothetical protein